LPLGLRQAVGHDPQHQRVETQAGMAAADPDVLVQRRVAGNRGFLGRHHAVAQGIQATHGHGQLLALAHGLGTRLHRVGRRAHRVGHQPVQGLDQRRRRASGCIDADRAAQRDHVAHAFARHVRAIHREHTAQAPADQADLAAALVVHVADLLFDGRCVAGAEAHVAAQPPGLHIVAAPTQEQFQPDQRHLAAHEPWQKQHRMPVPARRERQERPSVGKHEQLENRAGFEHRAEQTRLANVGMSFCHGCVVKVAGTRA